MISAPSPQQQKAINALKDNNVIINSVAGSGKTTTCLHVAKKYNDISILLLTYNARLKDETRARVLNLNLQNLEVHSFHAFCVKYYNQEASKDYGIINILENNTAPNRPFAYDIIIVDEAQDMTDLLYRTFKKIYFDNIIKARICILGDPRQCIYEFREADPRFIKYADQVFNWNSAKWERHPLTVSYRINNQMAEFINKAMFEATAPEQPIIEAQKDGPRPHCLICNPFYPNPIFAKICVLLRSGYLPQDIFILAFSVKSTNPNNPLKMLENMIKEQLNIPVFVPVSDEDRIDVNVIHGKLVISTFHQAKGLERKVVFVNGFDMSFFSIYQQELDMYQCPNLLYVAATRASEHLILIQSSKCQYLPFLNKIETLRLCNVEIAHKLAPENRDYKRPTKYSVTDFVRYASPYTLATCYKMLNIAPLFDARTSLAIPSQITQGGLTEAISEINGTAIPLYYEYLRFGDESTLAQCIKKSTAEMAEYELECDSEDEDTKEEPITGDGLTIANALQLTNEILSINSGYIFKMCQIQDYNWISDSTITQAMDRLNRLKLSSGAKFEVNAGIVAFEDVQISGRIDCIDGNCIYEFKVVNELLPEHYVQLAVYMYMVATTRLIADDLKKYFLYNINTNELVGVQCKPDDLTQIMRLINADRKNANRMGDAEFLATYMAATNL